MSGVPYAAPALEHWLIASQRSPGAHSLPVQPKGRREAQGRECQKVAGQRGAVALRTETTARTPASMRLSVSSSPSTITTTPVHRVEYPGGLCIKILRNDAAHKGLETTPVCTQGEEKPTAHSQVFGSRAAPCKLRHDAAPCTARLCETALHGPPPCGSATSRNNSSPFPRQQAPQKGPGSGSPSWGSTMSSRPYRIFSAPLTCVQRAQGACVWVVVAGGVGVVVGALGSQMHAQLPGNSCPVWLGGGFQALALLVAAGRGGAAGPQPLAPYVASCMGCARSLRS